MKRFSKKTLARVLCLFFVFSAFGGGLLSSGKWLDGQSYAIDISSAEVEHEVQTEGSEMPDANVDEEGGIIEDGADVGVDEETADLDAALEDTHQEKSGKRMVALSDEGIAPQADDTGAFNVTGGTYGVDYTYENVVYCTQGYGNEEEYLSGNTTKYTPDSVTNVIEHTWPALVIKTDKPLTISTNGVSNAGIYIEKGVQADLTFAGVNITSELPVNIMTNKIEAGAHGKVGTPTSLHLTLADGTNNSLICAKSDKGVQCPGIRCGEGSKLVIDDGRRNVDQNGQPVLPEDGKVSRDATLADGTVVKAGDRLTILDSDNPGTLTVNGGYRSAAIGGGPIENSGDMTFNGGNITAYAFGSGVDTDSNMYGAGCGIGGGHAGGGTVITVNGGIIDAKGSYHGAGFGGGCTYTGGMSRSHVTYAFTDAVFCATPSSTIAGDININGGFIKAEGFTHGNAFGQGCGGSNDHKTITITGGTLLPKSQSGWYDIGGAGGAVVVTGGSIRLTNNDSSKFQGTGYSDIEKTSPVFRTTIDLSGEGLKNNVINSWSLYINGQYYDYGAPSYFDEGKLYLWLPSKIDGEAVAGSEVKVVLSAEVKTEDGKTETLEIKPLYIDQVSSSGQSTLKRYVEFELPPSLQKLTKRYDGLPAQTLDLSVNPLPTGEKEADGSARVLKNNSLATVKMQRYTDVDGEAIGSEFTAANNKAMPKDAGVHKFTVTSTEYATPGSTFSASYYGHRGTGWTVIEKADSQLTDVVYEPTMEKDSEGKWKLKSMAFEATISPKASEAETCEAPDGYLQFYINGVKAGLPIAVNSGTNTTVEGENDGKSVTHNGKTVTKTINFDGSMKYPGVFENEDGQFIITASYTDGTNYTDSEAVAKLKSDDSESGKPDDNPGFIPEKDFPFMTPPTPTIVPDKVGDLDEDSETPIEGGKLKPVKVEPIEPDTDGTGIDDGDYRLRGYYEDEVSKRIDRNAEPVGFDYFKELLSERYVFTNKAGFPLFESTASGRQPIKIEDSDIVVKDKDGKEILFDEGGTVDLSKPDKYVITATIADEHGNETVIDLVLNLKSGVVLINPDINKDTNDDGKPDINIDKDGDGIPETNIDTDGDDKPDVNIDTDDDGKPDVNIDTDGDGKPDINKDTDGDGKPDVDIDTNDDGKPDVNIDTDGDGKPDINKDTDGDGKPDVDIDTNGDGKPDINKDTDGDGKPDLDIDTNGDGKPDVNIDTNGDGKPDINIDKNGDGKPDVNIDKDGDGKPDLNIDTDGDGKPDINIDKNGDGKPDVNIDKDGDGKPDLNIDTDGDGKPDINIDKNGDGKPDVNIDTDGDGKPDLNVDTDGDGIPDLNVDTDGDGIADVNIDTDGDGKPDKNLVKTDELPGWTDDQNGGDKNGDKTDELPWWIPRTGDTANMLIWIAVLAAAVLGLCGVTVRIRRKYSTK